MKLDRVEIENYRAIEALDLPLDPKLTVFHGANADGKTSVLSAIAVGLGAVLRLLPDVSTISFLKSDRHGLKPIRVTLTTRDGIGWDRGISGQRRRTSRRELKGAIDGIVAADREEAAPRDLPIVAYYDTDRAVFDAPLSRYQPKTEFRRYAALEGALSARPRFREFFRWFYAMENEELRGQKEHHDFSYRLKELEAVRTAITSMTRLSEPRVKSRPLRFFVSTKSEKGKKQDLEINQLSGGYRIVLALAADLARRMAQGNPHLKDPLSSEAIVLIDEVDLHLHPEWQQRILTDLLGTFPNTQFIVSTHSPQVLTTIKPGHIIELACEDGKIVAGGTASSTYGAEAGDVLAAVMGVDKRPPKNEFTVLLRKYMNLVGDNRGETPEALDLRCKLDRLSPEDHALDKADIEVRWRKLRVGKSK